MGGRRVHRVITRKVSPSHPTTVWKRKKRGEKGLEKGSRGEKGYSVYQKRT